MPGISSGVIEPEFHCHLASRIIGGKRPEGVDSLYRANRRLIQRRHAAGLLDPHVSRLAAATDVELHVHPIGGADAGIDLVLKPVLRDLLLDDPHIPCVCAAEISAATLNPESALRASGAKRSIRTAYWAA